MISRKRQGSGASKGQMFIIGSIIVLVILIAIRTSINVADVLEKEKFLESGVEKTEFSNLRSEVTKSAYNALNYSQNMTNVTNSFVAFAEGKLAARTISLDGVTVDSAYGNLTANANVPLNVTLYNFFDVDLTKAVLNLSTNFAAPVTFGTIPPGGTASASFTVNIPSSQNLTLWVYYSTSTEGVTSNITVPADVSQKSKFVDYFDIRMGDDRGSIRDRFFDTVNVN